MKNLLLLLLTGALLTSCGSYLTDDIISNKGTKVFEAGYDEVFEAVKGALVTEGYELAYVNKEKGKINTGHKLTRATAQGSQAAGIYRQYMVSISSVSENKTKVILTPKIYQGNNDISDDKVWVIEGKNGEISLWNDFFKQVEELL